jgi:hypothetical protein
MPLKKLIAALVAFGILALPAAEAHAQSGVSIQDPPIVCRPLPRSHASGARQYVRTELFFGTETPRGAVTEERFLAFLDAEVTTRFPDGLTLFKGHGQFTGGDGVLVKEVPFILILLHPLARLKESNRKIEEIRRLYKAAFEQESVLRVDYQFTLRVSF